MRRTLKRLMVIVLSCLCLAAPSLAQQTTFADALLDHMTGKWVLSGTIGGQKKVDDVDVEWVMNHQYLRIHEVSRNKSASGDPTYESTAFVGWNKAANGYGCIIMDTFGGISPMYMGSGKRSGDAIPFVFPAMSKDKLHMTYTYLPKSDTWTWWFDVEEKGKLTLFGLMTLARSS